MMRLLSSVMISATKCKRKENAEDRVNNQLLGIHNSNVPHVNLELPGLQELHESLGIAKVKININMSNSPYLK